MENYLFYSSNFRQGENSRSRTKNYPSLHRDQKTQQKIKKDVTFSRLKIVKNYLFYSSNYRMGENSRSKTKNYPPLYRDQKTPRKRAKGCDFFEIKNREKLAFFIRRIIGRLKNRGQKPKTTLHYTAT